MSWLDVIGLGADVLNAGYNAWTNKRDFDYQKSLQNEIFSREDNSVQRRVKDLQAAGLNPALAAGQGAGAGSVVSRSNTDSLGANLDTIQAINQIRLQKQETENAKLEALNKQVQNKILKDQQYVTDNERYISMAKTLYQLGIPFSTKVNVDSGNGFNMYVGADLRDSGQYIFTQDKSKLFKELQSNLNQLLTSEELLNRDANWYTADKISGMALGLLNALPFHINFKK